MFHKTLQTSLTLQIFHIQHLIYSFTVSYFGLCEFQDLHKGCNSCPFQESEMYWFSVALFSPPWNNSYQKKKGKKSLHLWKLTPAEILTSACSEILAVSHIWALLANKVTNVR